MTELCLEHIFYRVVEFYGQIPPPQIKLVEPAKVRN